MGFKSFIHGNIKLYLFKRKYRNLNPHNETSPAGIFRMERVSVGNFTYGLIDVTDWSELPVRLEIGNFCSIAPGVKFILAGDHFIQNVSTFPFKAKFGLVSFEALSNGSIVIKDDVWICANSIILSGVTIGQGAVVAAGSVVSKDIPPYAIVAGVPAKVIKYRFSSDLITKLLTIDYSKIKREDVVKNINAWYEGVTGDSIENQLNGILK
jgi:acetyltransferase-like isoleucine patch superfamily enzyme